MKLTREAIGLAAVLGAWGAVSAGCKNGDGSPADTAGTSSGGDSEGPAATAGTNPEANGGEAGAAARNAAGESTAADNSMGGVGGDGEVPAAFGGSSDGGAAGLEPLGQLGPLLGPTMDDQRATVLTPALPVVQLVDFKAMQVDGKGNIYVAATNGTKYPAAGYIYLTIAKFDASWNLQWSKKLDVVTAINDLVLTSDGALAFTGTIGVALPNEPFVGGVADGFVGRMSADGDVLWMHGFGSSGTDSMQRLAAGPDGSVIAVGTCFGQAQGNPPTNANGPIAVRFEANGKRTWLKQYALPADVDRSNHVPSSLVVDAAGYSFIAAGPFLRRLAADGAQLGLEPIDIHPEDPNFQVQVAVGQLALSPNGNAMFAYGVAELAPFLARLGLDGKVLWWRWGDQTPSAIIDSVEQIEWTGAFGDSNYTRSTDPFVVTNDAIYLTGRYHNTYKNGSIKPPATSPIFVGRYDFAGDRLWFDEFLGADASGAAYFSRIARAPGDRLTLVLYPNLEQTKFFGTSISLADGAFTNGN